MCFLFFVTITVPPVGIVELCAKILQIMRNDFKDYARTFFNSNFNQSRTEIEILCQHVNNDVSRQQRVANN